MSKERFDFIKLKINTNKSLAIMINNKRYTLNDANELVNEKLNKKLVKTMPLKNTVIW